MRFTNSAANVVLNVMYSRGLDPNNYHLQLKILGNGSLGLGFTDEPEGKIEHFGKLRVAVARNIVNDGVVVDFGEVNNRQGLIFLGEEQYVSQFDKESTAGN